MFRSLITLILLSFSTYALADNDEAGVRSLINGFVKAWNKHDPQAMAAFWADDGDLIDPWGKRGSNKGAVQSIFIGEQKGRLKDGTIETTIERIRFLTPDIALVDASGKITGLKDSKGKPLDPFNHHVFWVLKKNDGVWKAAAARPYQLLKPDPIFGFQLQ